MYYCDICNREVNGTHIQNMVTTRYIRSTPIDVYHEGLVCECCGHELYDDEHEMAITKEAISIYRRKAKLLAPEILTKLIQKFGPEKLAQLAHCSVSEIVNSAHGGVHSDKTDAALRDIINHMNPTKKKKAEVA